MLVAIWNTLSISGSRLWTSRPAMNAPHAWNPAVRNTVVCFGGSPRKFRYTTEEAVTNTTTADRALTSSSFIRVRISFNEKQQISAPLIMVRNSPIPCNWKPWSCLGPTAIAASTQYNVVIPTANRWS